MIVVGVAVGLSWCWWRQGWCWYGVDADVGGGSVVGVDMVGVGIGGGDVVGVDSGVGVGAIMVLMWCLLVVFALASAVVRWRGLLSVIVLVPFWCWLLVLLPLSLEG